MGRYVKVYKGQKPKKGNKMKYFLFVLLGVGTGIGLSKYISFLQITLWLESLKVYCG